MQKIQNTHKCKYYINSLIRTSATQNDYTLQNEARSDMVIKSIVNKRRLKTCSTCSMINDMHK